MNETDRGSRSENPIEDLYFRYRACMVRLTLKTPEGDLTCGSAFHIGDGWLVTARHVIKGGELVDIEASHQATIGDVHRIISATDPHDDVALLETDFSLTDYMSDRSHLAGMADSWKRDHIEIGQHIDEWMNDSLVMSRVLVMGYPIIPLSDTRHLVPVRAEVSAIVDKYTGGRTPSFVLSYIPRGGFSGGPVLHRAGFLLGVVTEALVSGDQQVELGLLRHCRWTPSGVFCLITESSRRRTVSSFVADGKRNRIYARSRVPQRSGPR